MFSSVLWHELRDSKENAFLEQKQQLGLEKQPAGKVGAVHRVPQEKTSFTCHFAAKEARNGFRGSQTWPGENF